ncbi:MAG TPA: helix-turn-helix transcriptional regulator [Polyangia bacterium]|nr:helix-turn-helix transcriptional regulator [Polyangia bacterium]
MTSEKLRKCFECGARAVRPVAKPGRMTKYRSMELEIPATVEIPTCTECNTQWSDSKTDAALDEALEGLYQKRLKERLNTYLDTILREGITQAVLERSLGVSVGYISKLKREERNPGSELVVALGLLATNPGEMIEKAADVFAAKKERRHG